MRIATNLLPLVVFTALLVPIGCGDDDRVPVDAAVPDADVPMPDVPMMPDGMVPDGSPDGMVEMCEPGLVDCGEGCTALAGDSDHCGACGNACPSGVSCAVGRCDCEAPGKSCDGLCTDPATDNDNCGMCGNSCREGDICLEGACVVDCESPDQRCPGTDGEFVCSDPQTDSVNCGVCGASCSSGAECVGGTCSCGEGQISCSGTCVDAANDADFCGNCLTSCGEDGVCTAGACSTCGTGLTACGDVARCTDTDTSRLHCGECDNTCGAGTGCTDGACTCLPGFVDCDGECAALISDRNNCGGCGISCGPLGTCSGGSCVCQPEATMCGEECAVLETDPNNCGACGDPCGSGEICRESTCLMLNATCATGTPITGDLIIEDEVLDDGGDRPTGTGCGFGSGSTALYYAITVPPGQRATAAADSTTDLVVFTQEACDDDGCTTASDFPERVTVDNVAGAADRTFYVGVRGYSSATGTFDIEFTYVTPVVATNSACNMATEITGDITIPDEDIEEGGVRPTGAGCGFGSGATALYYAVTVPVGQRARVVADGSSDLVVFSQSDCADTTCTNASDFPEEQTVDNALGMAPVTQYVGVRGYSSTTTGTFELQVTYTTPVVAANASCATGTEITMDTSISGEEIEQGGARPTGTNCGFGSGSSALYYAVTVPPGQRALVGTDSSSDLVVFRLNACGDVACINASDSPEEQTVDNALGTDPLTEYVGVRGYSSTTSGTFDVDVTYTTPVVAANASCATATEVTADIMFSDEATENGGPRPSASGCGFGSGTQSLYYAVTVPAGNSVEVQTSPSGDIVLFELDMCGAAACVTSTDSSPESLTYSNSTASPVTHIFGVRPYFGTGTPTFDIEFTYSVI
ncbi:MAG: hypothetical protein ACI9KE_000509 [Polyangiales bacterium]|jgi:hypothetical protein